MRRRLGNAGVALYVVVTLLMLALVAFFGWMTVIYYRCSQEAYPQEASDCLFGAWMWGLVALLLAAWVSFRISVMVRWAWTDSDLE